MSDDPTASFGVRNQVDMDLLEAAGIPPRYWYINREVQLKRWFPDRITAGAWLDTGFDVLDNIKPDTAAGNDRFDWITSRIRKIVNEPPAASLPARQTIDNEVHPLLDSLLSLRPSRISVPQRPFDKDGKRASRKINLALATSSAAWLRSGKFKGKLVLPVVFRNNSSYATPKKREAAIERIAELAVAARAASVWVVDEKINDDRVPASGQRSLLEPLLELHVALRDDPRIPHVIAGPYWLFQHLLIARGCTDEALSYPRHQFAYEILRSGGPPPARERHTICLMSLLRNVRVVTEVTKATPPSTTTSAWLKAAAEAAAGGQRDELLALAKLSRSSLTGGEAKRQQANAYLTFIGRLHRLPPKARSTQLFKAATEAMILASQIGDPLPAGSSHPGERKAERQPGRVAEELLTLVLPR